MPEELLGRRDDDFSMLEFPEIKQPFCKNQLSNNSVCFSNVVFSTLIFIQLTIICITGLVYLNDFNMLIADAKTNMKDLSILIPEVANVLRMVKQICDAPEYYHYCHDINTIH